MSNNKPQYIILHHSLTADGQVVDFNAIKRYHTETLGWSDIGYHWVGEYVNGQLTWFKGREETTQGAHCKEQEMNFKSIGICLVGNFDDQPPSEEQYEFLAAKVLEVMRRWNIPLEAVLEHHHFAAYKSCPGLAFNRLHLLTIVDRMRHWAYGPWERLGERGISLETRFDQPLTRGEAFALVDKILHAVGK